MKMNSLLNFTVYSIQLLLHLILPFNLYMRKSLCILFLSLSCHLYSQKVVFIIADGIPADVIENVSTPNINRISANGIYTRAHVGGDKGTYSQTPTISAVGYNSLLTGTWVNKHNVWGNDIKAPNYNYPTIFKLFKQQYPNKKIAIFSSWLDNRTKLVGDGLAATGNLKVDYYADGFELDTLTFPHDNSSAYMHLIDEKVTDEAVSSIKKNAPDLSWVYLEYTDDMGHRYGDSPNLKDAVVKMDEQIGKIWEAIQYRQTKFKEKWMIILTTDHGRDEQTGRNHGGQSARQRSTWMVSNVRFNDYVKYNQPAIVDIMPTMAQYLNVNLNDNIAKEIDGIPLIGRVSIAQPAINIFQNKLDLTWQALDSTGNAKIWLSTTNTIKTGGTDHFILLTEVPVTARHAVIDITSYPSNFYKVAIEARYNSVNKWFVNEPIH